VPALIVSLLLALLVSAPAATAAPAERPIVYVLVVDGLDGDAVDAGAAPFISSLLAGEDASATYFRESRSIIPAETNPNHVAMMSGAYAGRSGIVSNNFALYAPPAGEDTCEATGPEDLSKPPTITSGEDKSCLLADTVFAAVDRQGNPDGLVTAAVFGKPKLGRIFSGSTARSDRRDVDHLWAPCDDGEADDDYCESVPTNPVTGYAIDDKTVMDEVIRTIDEGVGADARRPDFTFVNLHQVDSAGHAFGRGPAYDAAVEMADQEISRLVAKLKERGEWERSVLVLASDHSIDTALDNATMSDVFADAGSPEDSYVVVGEGSTDLVYVARRSPQRFELLRRMREIALGEDAVAEALYRVPNPLDGGAEHTVGKAHPEWRVGGPRLGDLLLVAREGAMFADPSLSDNPVPGGHGAPQTRDNFMAVVGGGSFVRQQGLEGEVRPLFEDALLNPRQSENVDLAATVSGLFGLAAPRDNRGRFLREAFDLGALPGAGRPSARPRLKARGKPRGRSCAFRVTYGPKGGRYDLQARRGGRWRTLRRGSAKVRAATRAPSGTRFRVRARSASGAAGPWRARRGRC
jgi:ectonucleotide pyrophosphatase/phosphodiesterase family member 4